MNLNFFILILKFKSFYDKYFMFLDFLYCSNNSSLLILRLFKGKLLNAFSWLILEWNISYDLNTSKYFNTYFHAWLFKKKEISKKPCFCHYQQKTFTVLHYLFNLAKQTTFCTTAVNVKGYLSL